MARKPQPRRRKASDLLQTKTGLRWAIYARLSLDKKAGTDDEGENVETQIEFLTKWIYSRDPDANIVAAYCDNDRPASGQITAANDRSEFNAMLADAKNNVFDAAVARHLDRYTRRPRELEDLLDIHDLYGVAWHCATGEINLAYPMHRAMARNMINWSAYEGDIKVERMLFTYEQRARDGRAHTGGMRCYGYTKDGTALIEHEVEVIREMRDWVLPPNPGALRALSRMLNERGERTTTGGTWSPTTIVRLLTNPRLRGARTYHDEVVAENVFPRVFSDAEFADIAAYLNDPDRSQGEPKVQALLSGGILVCGKCGQNLTSQPSNSKKPGYVCRKNPKEQGCNGTRIQAEATEAEVAAKVLSVFVSPKIRDEVRRRSGERIDAGAAEELRRLQERLADLGRQWAAGTISTEARVAAENYLKREIGKLQKAIREAQRMAGLPADLPMSPAALSQWWTSEDTTDDQRRMLIRSVLKHVVVGPTQRRGYNGFEPERLTFVWL